MRAERPSAHADELAMTQLILLPCLDSDELAAARQAELRISRRKAAQLGASAVAAVHAGYYVASAGLRVPLREAVQAARAAKQSIAPDAVLPAQARVPFPETRIQVSNETTLAASLRFVQHGLRPLALNFANGIEAGGGFLDGALAQEEVLCRSSALHATLAGDPMYDAHHDRPTDDSTDWAILSPDVPVFRADDGTALPEPWLLSVLTCAAPYAPTVGAQLAGDLLQRRIHRVLEIAQAYGYESLVLGAWGCGAFENDPHRTATDFRHALDTDFRGAFSDIVFAITDWSPQRKFLGPFRDAFVAEPPKATRRPRGKL